MSAKGYVTFEPGTAAWDTLMADRAALRAENARLREALIAIRDDELNEEPALALRKFRDMQTLARAILETLR
jgi:hypothetical protein